MNNNYDDGIYGVCMSKHGFALLGVKVSPSLDFVNRCIRFYVFAINQLQRKNPQTTFGGMRSRWAPLIQLQHTNYCRETSGSKQLNFLFWLVLNLCTGDYWLFNYFILCFTLNLQRLINYWSQHLKYLTQFNLSSAKTRRKNKTANQRQSISLFLNHLREDNYPNPIILDLFICWE